MVTTIHYKDGTIEILEGGAPSVSMEEGDHSTVTIVDAEMMSLSEDLPLMNIKRLVFEP